MQSKECGEKRLYFNSDYLAGCHERILQSLIETNLIKAPGYGTDEFTLAAKKKILNACELEEGDVYFLVGGTQTNDTVISTFLRSYEGVISADTGHIATHEAGIIEVHGHKVLTIPHKEGKIYPAQIREYMVHFHADGNNAHMVQPRLVYLSQPTEFGTLYSLQELKDIREICNEYSLSLYVDGARLAYALACPENDVRLSDLAKLCDAFYIGGTKCGALFGEAVVIPEKRNFPFFPTTIKQHGALLAKGKALGVQFDALFTDDLYLQIGKHAIELADTIRSALRKKGIPLAVSSPTNQIFILLKKEETERIGKDVELTHWDDPDDEHSILRICTSWSTEEEDVEKLLAIL